MKIGIAIWKLDLKGGEQRQALELAKCLQSHGHEVVVYTAYYDEKKCFAETCRQLNIKFLYPGSGSVKSIIDRARLHLDVFQKSQELANLIDDDLDILNCHEYTTSITGVKYHKRTGVPIFSMINDTPSFNGVFEFSDSPKKFLTSFIKRKIYTHYLKQMNGLSVLDNMNKMRLEKYCKIFNSKVVRSGLDIDRFDYTERGAINGKIKLLAIGTFCPWRRYEDLMDACKILKDKGIGFELHHTGSDVTDVGYAVKIKNMASQYQLSDSVHFHGEVSEEKVNELFKNSDIFLFPNYPQTWGLVVFEAMATGIPVIASEKCGAAEVLEHEKNVILFPPKSPKKIAEMIVNLKNNPELRKNISQHARKFVEENIRWDKYAENMLGFFQNTIVDILRVPTSPLPSKP